MSLPKWGETELYSREQFSDPRGCVEIVRRLANKGKGGERVLIE